MDWGLLFDEVLIFCIATMLLLKWLILRRRTMLGRAIAWANLALSIAYYGALLAIHFPFFRSATWRWSIRVAVAVTAAHAILEIVGYYGGWRATVREVRLSLIELAEEGREALGMARWRLARGGRRLAARLPRRRRSE